MGVLGLGQVEGDLGYQWARLRVGASEAKDLRLNELLGSGLRISLDKGQTQSQTKVDQKQKQKPNINQTKNKQCPKLK